MKKILFILISFALLTTTGCNRDFLDTLPTDAISGQELFTTVAGAEAIIVGTNRLRFCSFFVSRDLGMRTPHYMFGERALDLTLDGMTEDFYETGFGGWYSDRALLMQIQRNSITDISVVTPWLRFFRMIDNVNQLIDNIDLIEDGTPSERDFWLAQGLIYRAHLHHRLVQIYALPLHSHPDNLGIPINIRAVNEEPLARSTVREVYDQIFADLHQAVALLDDNPVNRNISFASINVAHGILARAYSNDRQWDRVEYHANLARQGHALMTGAQFRSGFSQRNNEWMWASITPQDEMAGHADLFFRIMSNGIGYTTSWGYRNAVSERVFMHADTNDARFHGPVLHAGSRFVETRYILGTDTIYVPANNMVTATRMRLVTAGDTTVFNRFVYNKFFSDDGENAEMHYMRSAEFYLLEAEAMIQQGNFAGARANLQTLMDARTTGFDASSFADADLLDEIKMQRRLEFWGEGIRFHDIRRWGIGVDRNETNAWEFFTSILAFDPAGLVVPFNDHQFWTFQIPRHEMDANPNMVQN